MKPISDSTNIKQGIVLSYVALIVSIVGSLFVSNRILNYIGDYNYGLYSFVNSITSWLTITSSALTASFLRFTTAEARDTGNVDKTNTIYLKLLSIIGLTVIIIGLSTVLLFYCLGVRVGNYNWEDSELMYLLFAFSIINIGLTMPASIFSLYINYKKKFIFARLLSISITILTFVGNFLIAFYTKNILLISLFSILITILTFSFNCIYSRKYLNISFAKTSLRDNSGLIRIIVLFSGILLLNTIVDEINTNVDKTLLGFFSIPEDVTKYQMAQQLAHYLTVMSVAVSGVFAPTIHEMVAKKDTQSMCLLYLKISKIQSIVLCCVAFGFLACGYNFILWWLGNKRIASYYVGAALMIINLGPLTLNASIEIQRAMDRHKFRALIYFIFAIANVGLSILFLCLFDKTYAIYSCLLGTLITRFGSHWIAMNIYNKRIIGLPIGKYLINLFFYMMIGLLSFGFVFFVTKFFDQNISSPLFVFLIQGSLFVIVYLAICFFFNRKEVVFRIRKILRKKI